ncbi:MAG: hydrogenase maturation protease, partial [Thermoleophilia bacterium]
GSGVNVVAGGVAGMAMLSHFLESDAVIVIDAIDAGAEPGAIFRFDPDEAGVMSLRSNNIHGMGVPHLVTNARLKGADPEVIVFAVQVESVNPRDRELSPAVAASVTRVRELVADEVARLQAV